MKKRKLAGLRITAGYTQKQVADILGVTQGAVSFWERGDCQPPYGKVALLANLYGVSVEEIVDICVSNVSVPVMPGVPDN